MSYTTPMIRIRYRYQGSENAVYAKLESYNPTGSIKDRIAAYIMKKAEESGALRPGQPILEVTSGNTGIAFAALGAATHHPVHILMPSWASSERKAILRMYGAVLHEVTEEQGGFLGALAMSEGMAEELGAWMPRQFSNPDNADAHYYTSGAEISRHLPNVTDFISGVGSGGTIMGIGRRLKEDHGARVTAIQPDALPLLTGGVPTGKPHKIEGIGDDFIPPLYDPAMADRILDINDDDAVIMASRLGSELGLGVGISSGANFLGCVLSDGPGRTVCTVFADDNKKYLSTALSCPPALTGSMISSRIELLDWSVLESET